MATTFYDEYDDDGYETDDTEVAEDFKYELMRYGEASVVIRGYHYADRETIFQNNKYMIDNNEVTITYVDDDEDVIEYKDIAGNIYEVSTKEFVDRILDGRSVILYSLWDAFW